MIKRTAGSAFLPVLSLPLLLLFLLLLRIRTRFLSPYLVVLVIVLMMLSIPKALPRWKALTSPAKYEHHTILIRALTVALECDFPTEAYTLRSTLALRRAWKVRHCNIQVLGKHLALLLDQAGFHECLLIDGRTLKMLAVRDCTPALKTRVVSSW